MTTSQERFGLLLGLAGMCLFAGTLPATRLAVRGLDPWFLTSARAAIAGTTGLIVLVLARRRLPASLWLEMFAAGACTVLGFPLLAALAMVSVPAAHGGVVLGILPLATTAAASIFAHERPSRGFWLVSIAGAIIGDTCGYWIGRDGQLVDHPLNRRVIGLAPDALRNVRTVILASGGLDKVTILRAALRHGSIGMLVTDERTAEAILAE